MLAILLFCIPSISSFALSFNGTASAGGDGSNTTASTGGYAIPGMLTVDSNRAVGYRFTVIDAAGTAQKSCKDMFRYSSYTSFNQYYIGMYKFNTKYPKTYYKTNYTSGSYTTSDTTSNVCHDTDYSLALPEATTGLEAWCTNANMGVILDEFWGITISTLESNGWAILAEPIFPLKIEDVYHVMTVTEIGVYGTAKFGSNSTGGASSNSNSWGFISRYTNQYMPNALRLTAQYAGLPAANESASRLSFGTIVTGGYGAAIIYGSYLEKKPEIYWWNFYQEDYNGFWIYVRTECVSTLKIEVWTDNAGKDDVKTYNAIWEYNLVHGSGHDWKVFIPRSEHKYEIGNYSMNFYGYTSSGASTTKSGDYQPPAVTDVAVVQNGPYGFYVYCNAVSSDDLVMDVWTENRGDDDLLRHSVNEEVNVINGVTYHWKGLVNFSSHNKELGLYLIDFYAKNYYSEYIYSKNTTFQPDAYAQLRVECCEIWFGYEDEQSDLLGTSYGDTVEDYVYNTGYPAESYPVSFRVYFPSEERNDYVCQKVWTEDEGGCSTSRYVYSKENEWYTVGLIEGPIDDLMDSITIYAQVNLLDSKGNVLQYGKVKEFFFPIAPNAQGLGVGAKSITGELVAYNGYDDGYGCVYVGQRIYPTYTYLSLNDWDAKFDFYSEMFEWTPNGWENATKIHKNKQYDMEAIGVEMGKNERFYSDTTAGVYTVPDNSASGESFIKFNLWSYWHYDPHKSLSREKIDLYVVESDVVLEFIQLYDENGDYIDPEYLTPGQVLNVEYIYSNMTDCIVYVEGYDFNKSKIDGIYEIYPYDFISVYGGTITVPEENFNIWGGVYLEGAGLYNTQYEANGDNNEYVLECKVQTPLKLVPIEPNADYREGTEVITSYWLVNGMDYDITPYDCVDIAFRVYDGNSDLIYDTLKICAVVPAYGKNLIYFKWSVPYGSADDLFITEANIMNDELVIVENSYTIAPYGESSTPDTVYEKQAPDGFNVPDTPQSTSQKAEWYEYEYNDEDGDYFTRYYGIELSGETSIKLHPQAPGISVDSAFSKSGYPFSVEFSETINSVYGYLFPNEDAYTGVQRIAAKFPEYNYSSEWLDYKTLIKEVFWGFENELMYGRLHFIPIYFPNTNYYVLFEQSDLWTPAGMITATAVSEPLTINGCAYDDWYLNHF